ncbi:MAG TPA: class I SAM-dependent methyltransferase [Longimicrobium sp.]|nr:class I SAM-dependent methyltransferase [Longimicrobium sp.]
MKRCLACGSGFAGVEWRCPVCGWRPGVVDGVVAFAPEWGDDGYEARFFAALAEAEPGHFWFEARNRLIAQLVGAHFPSAASFLEIGCGTGFVLAGLRRAFPAMSLTGSELFPEGLTHARSRVPDAQLFQMDARAIPFDAEFEAAGAFDVLEHVDDDARVLAEMRRAVRPGGGIILTVPQHPWLWSALDDIAHHQRRYTRRGLLDLVRGAGFTVERATSFVSTLLPAMVLARLRKRRAAQVDPMAELRIAPGLNRALAAVLDAERVMIGRGISFPAGGSLVVVARR